MGNDTTLTYAPFPTADGGGWSRRPRVPVQVNGKVRSRMTVPANADGDVVRAAALAEEKIAAVLDGRSPRKVIVVPGRLVNVVV